MVYTRTGDKGKTSLFTGERVFKTNPTVEALGQIDELNANLGVAIQFCGQIDFEPQVEEMKGIQNRLFEIGSHVATPRDSDIDQSRLDATKFSESHVDALEYSIDLMDSQLPSLKNFIIPGSGFSSAHLHVCRTKCRTTERRVSELVKLGKADLQVGKYLNRLSDYFFVISRYACMKDNQEEVVYKS
jgi:cob(I)alamin adenosyltransferase